jgi:hyperpolarization activated cyclic nucleotide-gated potassium channel 2
VIWDLVIAIFIFYVTIVTPLRLGFPKVMDHVAFVVVDHIMDCIFVVDLVLNFFIAVEINGVLYTDLAIVRSRYIRGWFGLDVCASIPVGTLLWATGTGNSAFSDVNKSLRMVRAIKLTRVFKILQEGRFGVLIEQIEAVFKFNPGTARILKMLGLLVILWHWIGCFYWSIASGIGFGQDDWVPAPHLENATFDGKYSTVCKSCAL